MYQENRSVELVKYIAFWEFDPDDFEKVTEKFLQIRAERGKENEKYPKSLSAAYTMIGKPKGFQLFETDDSEQLANLTLHYVPLVEFKFVPIIESSKGVELYQKMKI